MTIPPELVLQEIARQGGQLSAALLEALIREHLRPEHRRREAFEESLSSDPRLDDLPDRLEAVSRNPALPFNLIPSFGRPGACCPLCVGIAAGGFGAASSVRRPNFNQLALLLAAHWLRCQSVTAETLILTPDWNQTTFDRRFADLFTAYRDTGRRAFIVEVARTGLILRWPY